MNNYNIGSIAYIIRRDEVVKIEVKSMAIEEDSGYLYYHDAPSRQGYLIGNSYQEKDMYKTRNDALLMLIKIKEEELEQLMIDVKRELSSFEKKVLSYYIQGASYYEISRVLDCSNKSVDNALQRIRKKIGKRL